MNRWGEDTTFKFVSEYLNHECLWNIKSPLYKNKQAKQCAYNNIEEAMNISGFGEKEIKLKIKNIRSTYSQELKKIKDSKKSGAGTDTIYVPTVKWFSLMDNSLRDINTEVTESESNLQSLESTDGASSCATDTPPLVETEFRDSRPPNKKQKRSQLFSIVKELKGITETANNPNPPVEENKFEVFGRHVGLKLKSLPMLLALEAQEHIQLHLNKIRRRHLQNSSVQNRATTSQYYVSQDPYSPTSTYSTDNSCFNENSQQQLPISQSSFENQGSSENLPLSNITNTSSDIIAAALNMLSNNNV